MTVVTIPPPASEEQRTHLLRLLRQFSTAMLITHAAADRLRARPMAIAQITDDGKVWFITGHETAKAHEIATDTRVHVVCQDDRSVYLSLSGQATLVEDRKKVEELWQEPFKIWFPEGPGDPSIVLIAVTLEQAEFWDNEGWNKVKQLVESADAYVHGTTPQGHDENQHSFVRL